ncbi:Protein of unknown function [Roseovarius azorensis]|uniref:DUF1523 domain-containing protein n=1 Tax=Roseovarius azorensis TaxID=1287727 RepID=A0A1H7J2F9_9RHOB|nr:DUF1523 family protein [Roseovarius azorensis]SEK68933.1 Protein of unknown function [Roseovarius azorensis]
MVYVKWVLRGLFWIALIVFLHYTLPQHDVVRITDTYEKRVNPGDNALFWSNADTGERTDVVERDVFFIQTFRSNDKPMIYRNEDTGWGWPPYFKFNTSNLQAQASDLISKKSAETAQWVVVRHYGWRNEFFSIYPNAVSIRAAEGPDARVIPWFNIVLLTLLAAIFWAIRVRWNRFWQARGEQADDEWSEGMG